MQRILKIARREYIETAKTKTFIIGLLMTPVIIGAIIFFSSRFSGSRAGPRPDIKVAVTDLSRQLAEDLDTSFDNYNEDNPNRKILLQHLEVQQDSNEVQTQGKARLRKGEADYYVVISENILQEPGKINIYTYKPKPAIVDKSRIIGYLFSEAVRNRRYQIERLDQDLLDKLRNVPIERMEIGSTDDQEQVQTQTHEIVKMMVPFFFMYMIFMGMVGTGQQMLGSIIEEKGSRIIEVLLSAVSPFQLMAGKILGLAGIGLTVIALWFAAAYAAVRWQDLNVDVSIELLLYFGVYYILGFLFFSATLTGIGSVCNTIKETQRIPMIAWPVLIDNPNGTMARVFSFIPPVTPMVMILRLSAGADVWFVEIGASVLLLAVAVWAVIWAAAKIFRTGILMYGKKPGLFEILRWLRQS
ncbi:MAG: ABC transporter permease [Planctomycetota bacterium]|jgi:ABC-2 type transport system permease protein